MVVEQAPVTLKSDCLNSGTTCVGVSFLSAIFATAVVALFVLFCWYVVARLQFGVDLSDSAYYIISYAMHRDIESQSTLAGWLWAGLSPFSGIRANRYLNVVVLLVAFGALGLATRSKSEDGVRDVTGLLLQMGFSLAGALTFYFYWVTDPSYNSMNLQFIALGWAAFFMLLRSGVRQPSEVRAVEYFWGGAVGAVIASVALIKMTSAALLGGTLFAGYLAVFWSSRGLRGVPGLAGTAAIGMTIPFVVLALAGEGPDRVISTLSNGVTVGLLIRPPSLGLGEPLRSYFKQILTAPLLRNWYFPVTGVLVALALSGRSSTVLTLRPSVRLVLSVVGTVGFVGFALHNHANLPLDNAVNVMALLAFILAFGASNCLSSPQQGKVKAVIWAMLASPVIYAYGTGNSWQYQFIGASGFAWVAVGAVVAAMSGWRRVALAIPCVGLLGLTVLTTTQAIELQPYRLQAPLSKLNTRARVGPFDELFFDSPSHAEFYNKLAAVRPLVQRLPERPYVIDLTGRAPMVAYQIGARAPRTPWLISGYPGSEAVFSAIIGGMSRTDRMKAWVFHSAELASRLPDTILEKFGLNFPKDYVAVERVPVEYMRFRGTLFAPRATFCNGAPGSAYAKSCSGG